MSAKIPGFSLIEIAVVLIIIGVIGGMTFPALKMMLDTQKATTTTQNQEKILYALASYALKNKFLPYAANPNANGNQDIATQRRRGIVPYADLGLSEAIAKDGYHHWLTYVVDADYATPPRQQGTSLLQQPRNKLCEISQSSTYFHPNPLNIKNGQKNIAFALISHGPQGRGAYPNPFASPPLGNDEKQNATSDTEIVDHPLSQDPQNPFSHTVVWVTAPNLLAIYGRAPCPSVENTPQPTKSRHLLGEGLFQKKQEIVDGDIH